MPVNQREFSARHSCTWAKVPRVLPILASGRLRLSPATEEHLDLMQGLNGNPAVMENLTGRPSTRDETAKEWTKRLGERDRTP